MVLERKVLTRSQSEMETTDSEKSHHCTCQDSKSLIEKQQPTDYVRFNFSRLCRFTVSLPLFGLVVCFVSANIFQQNDIHETYCRVSSHRLAFLAPDPHPSLFFQVYNIIPSISSITGISPQRYIWRICIALHVGPRFLTSLVYHRFYLTMLVDITQSQKKTFLYLVWLAFILNLTEQAALIGVTYVSNRENYRESCCY